MPLPPIWLTADLQRLDIPGTNGSYRDFVNATTTALNKAVTPVVAKASKEADINARLKAWYTEKTRDAVDPVKDLTDAASNYIADTLNTGVHLYLPVPEFGGFSAIRDTLTRSLTIADPNRPDFSDAEHVAGVVILAAGGKLETLTALAAIVTFMGGDATQITTAIGDLMTHSNVYAELADQASGLAYKAQQVWDDTDHAVMDWWNHSTVGKVAGSVTETVHNVLAPIESFPKNIFDAVNLVNALVPPPIPLPVIPPLPTVGSVLGDAFAGTHDPLIGHWKALTVGSAVNAIAPGAAAIAKTAAVAIDSVGTALSNEGDLLTKALDKRQQEIIDSKKQATQQAGNLGDIVGAHLNELGKLSVSALVIPPATGGIHQLGWALSQGLSEHAANAPSITEDQTCFAVFIVGSASDIATVSKTIQQVGQVFGIPLLANWGK